MNDNVCMFCKGITSKTTSTIKITDNDGKRAIYLTGHIDCTDEYVKRIREIKDLEKKRLKVVLEEIGMSEYLIE